MADENLQQYFYFSRDKIGAIAGAVQRLSARAQEVLSKLLHESEAYRKSGLQELGQLSGADVAGVLDIAAHAVRRAGVRSIYATGSACFWRRSSSALRRMVESPPASTGWSCSLRMNPTSAR